MRLFFLTFFLVGFLNSTVNAQSLAVNNDGSTADASAILDVKSSAKGLLIPRVSTTGSITSPATGLIIYVTTGATGFYYNAGTPGTPSWKQLLPADGSGSSLTSLNASNLSTGTVPTARLGTGTANNTTYLRGDGTWNTPSGGSALPTQTGNSGKVLTTDGTNASWGAPGSTQVPNGFFGHGIVVSPNASYASPFAPNSLVNLNPNIVGFFPPTSGTLTLNIYSFYGVSTTYQMIEVTPNAASQTWTEGATVGSSLTLSAWSSGSPTTGTITVSLTTGKVYTLKATTSGTNTGIYFTTASYQ